MKRLSFQGDVYHVPETWLERLHLFIGLRRGYRKGYTVFGPVWVEVKP